MIQKRNQKVETEIPLKDLNPKTIWNIIIVITIGMLLTFSYILITEISNAKKGCEEIEGSYNLVLFEHNCNNQTFVKYNDGSWNFVIKEINLDEINISEIFD